MLSLQQQSHAAWTDFERNYASVELQRKDAKSLTRLQMLCNALPNRNPNEVQSTQFRHWSLYHISEVSTRPFPL